MPVAGRTRQQRPHQHLGHQGDHGEAQADNEEPPAQPGHDGRQPSRPHPVHVPHHQPGDRGSSSRCPRLSPAARRAGGRWCSVLACESSTQRPAWKHRPGGADREEHHGGERRRTRPATTTPTTGATRRRSRCAASGGTAWARRAGTRAPRATRPAGPPPPATGWVIAYAGPARCRAAPATAPGPSSSIDSNSGGETRRPVIATRTGPKALRGLSPGPRRARRAAPLDGGGVPGRPGPASASLRRSARPPAVLVEELGGVGRVALEAGLVDEQEAQHVDGLGQRGHPLVHQGRGLRSRAPAGRRATGVRQHPGGLQERHHPLGELVDAAGPAGGWR